MARYNEILVGRYARGVQKLFGMKGEVPVASLAGEMTVAHTVFNGAENRYLEGWERFAAFASQGALAANTSGIRMRNPSGSNMLAVFERIIVANVAGATDFPVLQLGAANTDLATAILLQANAFDSRTRPTPTMVQSRTNNPTALFSTLMEGAVLVGGSFDFIPTDIDEFPLLPGSGIQIVTGIVNQRLDVSFIWRERFLEDSERS